MVGTLFNKYAKIPLTSMYCHACGKYNKVLDDHVQGFSTNQLQDQISDEEILTICLCCTAYEPKINGKSLFMSISSIIDIPWFPNLPSFQAFNEKTQLPGFGFSPAGGSSLRGV